MSERAGAAIDVDLVVSDADILHRRHGDAGKGFVDFIQIDGIGIPAESVLQSANREHR